MSEYLGALMMSDLEMEEEELVRLLAAAGGYLFRLAVVAVLWWAAAAIMKRFIDRLSASWRSRGHVKRADTLAAVLHSLSNYTLGFIGVCAVLSVFNIPVGSVLAVAGVSSVAVGFGAQSLVKDVITGFFILFEGQFGVGDIVTIAGVTGSVEAIGMRTTKIKSTDGSSHIFPNSNISFVTNMSGSYGHAVADINADIDERAFRALCGEMRGAKEKLGALTSDPSVIMLGEPPSRSVRIIAECRPGENAPAARELAEMAKECLKKEGAGVI